MRSRVANVVGLVAAGLVWLSAAEIGDGQLPQFRSSVDIVHLDVSVLDDGRRPVLGLKPEDFTVFEDGRPQRVSVFSEVLVPSVEPPTAPWIQEVAPDVRTNEGAKDQRLFVIAIDDAAFGGDLWAKKQMKEIAHGFVNRLPASDLVSVVYSQNNGASQDFTNDREKLRTAIEAMIENPGGVPSTLAAFYSIGLLRRAAEFLADVPDRRKAIIYIGTGLPFSMEAAATPIRSGFAGDPVARERGRVMLDLKDRINDLFDTAKRANINIYTIDACGLRAGGILGCGGPKDDILDFFVGVARQTGARSVMNTNDFEPGLDAIIEENASYYLIGFESDNPKRDGSLRQLRVTVNRDGVTVRTRSGYFAQQPAVGREPERRASLLARAVSGIIPSGQIPLRVTAIPVASPGRKTATVAVIVGLSQALPERLSRTLENIDLIVSAYNTDGKSFGTTKSRFAVTLRRGGSTDVEHELLATLDLPPGRYQLRVGAQVESTQSAGSVYYDVIVPDFNRVQLASSNLVFSTHPPPQSIQASEWRSILPQAPTSRRSFLPIDRVSTVARYYQLLNARPIAVEGRLTIRNSRDETVVERLFELVPGDFVDGVADYRFEIPTDRLQPGEFLMTVQAVAGATSVRRDARFKIISRVP